MKKNEWQELYNKLNKIHSDFSLVYPDYDRGKNKKIREDAERKISYLLHSVKHYVEKNDEVYKLLTGGDNNSDYGRATKYDEFLRPTYFSHDMAEFLRQIKAKINSADE